MCEYCLIQGPHNNQLHVVDYLIFYHEKRVELFKRLICEKVGSKKQKIFDQTDKVKDAQDTIM